jgi:hypothetical protein
MTIIGSASRTRMTARRGVLACTPLLCGLVSTAAAQWSVTNLHPQVGEASQAVSVLGDRQTGWVTMDGSTGHGRHGGYWLGSAGTWADLNPIIATGGSRIYSYDGQQYAGVYFAESQHRACIWDGPMNEYTSLHPTSEEWSVATGVHAGQQVGWVMTAVIFRAALWTGSAASFVDLQPPGATSSKAVAVHGGRQVGWATIGNITQAGFWNGSSASWTSLHTAGAELSEALAVHGEFQAGFSLFNAVAHAGMWNGTAGSWVDLRPAGSDGWSMVMGMHEDLQVGFAEFNNRSRASLWSGSASSWVDLHALLGPEFTSSTAAAVWTDGATTHIVGWGFNGVLMRDEALLWTIPAPGTTLALFAAGVLSARRTRRHQAVGGDSARYPQPSRG